MPEVLFVAALMGVALGAGIAIGLALRPRYRPGIEWGSETTTTRGK